MKLTITQPDLLAIIGKGGSVAPKTHASAIVTSVRLTATDGFLSVASTDLDRFAEAKGVAQVEEAGAITVTAGAFGALIQRLPRDKPVSLEVEETGPNTHHLIVKAGRSRSKLAILPADDFPAFVDPKGDEATFTMTGAAFAEQFGRVRPFTEPSGFTKPMLQGVNVTGNGENISLVAMDMMMAGRTRAEVASAFDAVIVPNEAVDAAIRMFKAEEEVTISISRNVVTFSNYAMRLGTKLIEGMFPDMEPALAFETIGTVTVRRPDLIAAVERATLGAAKEGQWECIILIPGDGVIEVKGANTEGGEVRDEVEATFEGSFQPVAFSPRRLAVVLASVPDDEIEIRQNANNCVVVGVGSPEYASLIAPLRSNVAMAA